jgi:hypothetical protein
MADLASSWSEISDDGPEVAPEPVAAPIAVLRPEQPDILRAAVRGGVIGFFLVGVVFGCLALAAGESAGGSLGLGFFVGFWGGIGWGAMTGASLTVMLRPDDGPE